MNDETSDKQILYRDARTSGAYNDIWQNVGKCVFCDLNDKYIFYEEKSLVMTVPLFAYTDGHCMIIPRRHVKSVKELTPSEWETVRKMMYMAKKLIRKTYGIKGMQLVQKDGTVAQSTVEHLHFHCVPFDDPSLSTWNYHTLANTPMQNANLFTANKNYAEKLAKRFSEKYEQL